MRPLVATAGVALAVLLGGTPAGRAGAAPGPAGSVQVTLDRSTVASVIGEHITVRCTVTNAGACGNTFVATRTWSATDACSNAAQ